MSGSRVNFTALVGSADGTAAKYMELQKLPRIGESLGYGPEFRPTHGKVLMVYHEPDGRITMELEPVDSDFIQKLVKHAGWRKYNV